jgi:hypothetical protein
MNWELKNVIEEFKDYSYQHWMNGIRLGFLIYFSKERLQVLNLDTFEDSFNDNILGDNVNYFIANNEIYFRKGKSLYHLNLESDSATEVCTTKEDYITLLNDSYCLGRTVTRRPRSYKSSLIRMKENDVVFEWEDSSMPIYITQSNIVIFENKSNLLLKGFDIKEDKEVWSLQLFGNPTPRFYQYLSDDLFLIMQCYDTDHPVDKRYELCGVNTLTGEILYKLDVGSFNKLVLNNEQKLFGLKGQQYLSVDPLAGEILESKDIEELDKLWADIGNQSITDSDIFFIVFGKPLVGRFNIKTQKVEDFITIDVDDSKVDMTQPLGVPFYHNEKLYVRDNSGVMHILQREGHPA